MVVRHQNSLQSEVVDSPYLEAFKARLDRTLCNDSEDMTINVMNVVIGLLKILTIHFLHTKLGVILLTTIQCIYPSQNVPFDLQCQASTELQMTKEYNIPLEICEKLISTMRLINRDIGSYFCKTVMFTVSKMQTCCIDGKSQLAQLEVFKEQSAFKR